MICRRNSFLLFCSWLLPGFHMCVKYMKFYDIWNFTTTSHIRFSVQNIWEVLAILFTLCLSIKRGITANTVPLILYLSRFSREKWFRSGPPVDNHCTHWPSLLKLWMSAKVWRSLTNKSKRFIQYFFVFDPLFLFFIPLFSVSLRKWHKM